MKKKVIALSLTLVLAFCGVVYAAGVNGSYKGRDVVRVLYEGKELTPDDVPGQMLDGRTMIPVGLLRKAGFTVEWDAKSLTANVTKPQPTLDQISDMMDSVFEIKAYTSDVDYQQGSGFIIGNYLVTNYHVVGESDRINVLVNGQWITKTHTDVAYSDKSVDFAIISMPGYKSLNYSTELPKIGDTVYTMGFPQGKFRMTQGEVLTVTAKEGTNLIFHNAATDSGISGGILFNSSGDILGITSRGSDNKKVAAAIPINYIEDALGKLK